MAQLNDLTKNCVVSRRNTFKLADFGIYAGEKNNFKAKRHNLKIKFQDFLQRLFEWI